MALEAARAAGEEVEEIEIKAPKAKVFGKQNIRQKQLVSGGVEEDEMDLD